MLRTCWYCKDWGELPDKLFFKPENCPLCRGARVITEEEDMPRTETKEERKLWKHRK